ncbi:MAG: PEP-CTERM sorting domain-containing protein [Acidobacteria bacterium]|nr:PEP-CTERM sorting domain-containing protein [Acidobacteriota bacterium]
MKITNILAGALLLTSSAFAATINYGVGGAKVTLGNESAAVSTFDVTEKIGNARSSATLKENGYEWLMSWNVDPVLSWSFSTTTPGLHTIDFFVPIVNAGYIKIFNSGGYTVTGGKGGLGAGITGLTIEALVPYTPITNQPLGFVDVPDTTGVKGSLSKSDDNTNSGGVGPYVAFGPQVAADMGVRVSFTAILAPGDQLGLNGTLEVLTPEPATFGLIGAALLALGALARRRA